MAHFVYAPAALVTRPSGQRERIVTTDAEVDPEVGPVEAACCAPVAMCADDYSQYLLVFPEPTHLESGWAEVAEHLARADYGDARVDDAIARLGRI